jgi:hypothetical protein
MHRFTKFLVLASGSLLFAGAAPSAERTAKKPPRSRLAVASARAAPGSTVRLPVELLDRAGTPLGAERGAGARIQGLALRVRCLPCAGIAALAVEPAGELSAQPSLFEARPTAPDGASLVVAFDEILAPLALGGGGARPARAQVATVVVTLARTVPSGSRIELRLDPGSTGLSNQAGTISETAKNGWLELRDGEIVVGKAPKGRG